MASFVKVNMIVRSLWIPYLCIAIPTILSQSVQFSVRDESNNRFVFTGETNIELVCQYSGFSNAPLSQINYNGNIISIGSSSLSDNYTITTNGDSTILTIKMASEYTAGTYTCLVVDTISGLQNSTNFNFEVLTLTMGPRCWSSVPLQDGVVPGQRFYADCFYSDKTDNFYSEWSKILLNGTEIPITSTEIVLPGKKKRTLTVPAVEVDDKGVLYRCSVAHKTTMFIRLSPCEIGPAAVYEDTTMLATSSFSFTNSLFSTTRHRSITKNTMLATSSFLFTNTLLNTTKQRSITNLVVPSDPSFFDGLSLYIILAIAVAFFLFLIILIVICLYCCKNSKDNERPKTQTEKEKSESSTTTPVNPLNVYNTLPVDNGGSYYDAPPSDIPDDTITFKSAPLNIATIESSGYINETFSLGNEKKKSFSLPGPEDMVSTHL